MRMCAWCPRNPSAPRCNTLPETRITMLRYVRLRKKKIAGEDEKEIYQKLGMEWIPYELRRNNGEIEAAQKKSLPKLINFGDIRGDLQTQTNWTDGKHSMEEMAKEI